MSDKRKLRPDAWWARISPEHLEIIFEHGENHTIDATVRWIASEFGVVTNTGSLSRWLTSQRQERKLSISFEDRLERLRNADLQSRIVGETIENTLSLHQANVLMLSQALMDAQLEGDDRATKAAATRLAQVLEALAKAQKAKADVENAQLSRDRFQFDAAKAALACAAELQEINRSNGSEREKVQRAIVRLFGEKPAHVRTAAEMGL